MPNATVDDQDSRVLYAGPWSHYRGLKGDKYNSSDWSGSTFSSCGGPGSGARKGGGGPGCELRVSFVGTSAALYGDSNGEHGQFNCRLLDEQGQPEGLWGWYDGGSRWWYPYQHNMLLCRCAPSLVGAAGERPGLNALEPSAASRACPIATTRSCSACSQIRSWTALRYVHPIVSLLAERPVAPGALV